MNEMKSEDVMRALECCAVWGECKNCPYDKVPYKSKDDCCTYNSTQDALALLREKNALIAKHEAYIDTLNDDKSNLVEQIEKKDAEIERLTKERDLANAEREANVKGFTEELQNTIDRYKGVIRILEQDVADRDKLLEGKVEATYSEFMRDYKQLQEEYRDLLREIAKDLKEDLK